MTDNLFANLTEYLSQMEARVAQLEAREAALTAALANAEARLAAVEANHDMDDLLARIEDLENQEPLYAHPAEREVEVELVYDDDDNEDDDEQEPIVEPAPVVAPEPEPVVAAPEPVAEPVAAAVPVVEEPTVAATVAAPTGVVPHLDDLKKGISLGDRFLYQRELFAGNGELMTKTIAVLNDMASFDDADAYLKKNFQWNTESNAYELFYNLLRRRW